MATDSRLVAATDPPSHVGVNGAPDMTPPPPPEDLSIRCVYRSSEGVVDLNWPVERISEALADGDGTLWVEIFDPGGAHTPEIEQLFREVFAFHPLAIEDALTDANMPKLDEWDPYLYLVFHAIDFDRDNHEARLHELDGFLARQYLVTYRTRPLAMIDRVWALVTRDSQNRLRRRPDHLLYLLMDAGVSDHLLAIEHLDEAVDEIMDEAMTRPTQETLQQIFQIKRAAARIYRVIVPQREVANRLSRDNHPQVGERDRVYFRDVYDGLVRLHDLTEGIRDLVAGAMDTYLSVSANRTNEIMKTLTIVTVLFLPLNFAVGFFGMNFFGDNIALDGRVETHTVLFLLCCLGMIASSVSLWFWGRYRRWF